MYNHKPLPFRHRDYLSLHSLVFQPDYPGYKPEVIESPNGDGKLDTLKRYAHVSVKYCNELKRREKSLPNVPEFANQREELWNVRDSLYNFLTDAHAEAEHMAVKLGIPPEFWPKLEYGALRVLEYGPYAVTHPHTDFSLFTLSCYRNNRDQFKYLTTGVNSDPNYWTSHDNFRKALAKACEESPGIHFGELMQEILPSSFQATPHEVVSSGGQSQYSVVYFAIPSHEAKLPSGLTVGEWLDERKKRSRYKS